MENSAKELKRLSNARYREKVKLTKLASEVKVEPKVGRPKAVYVQIPHPLSKDEALVKELSTILKTTGSFTATAAEIYELARRETVNGEQTSDDGKYQFITHQIVN